MTGAPDAGHEVAPPASTPRSTSRATIAYVVAAIVALVGGVLAFHWIGSPGGTANPAVAVLSLVLPDGTGKEVRFEQWRGRVLVVNFWATWCAPCREEMPEFVRLQEELGGRGLQFVGIAVDQADKVLTFGREINVNYPLVIGGYGAMELSKVLGNRLNALPFTVVFNRTGGVAHVQLGPLKEKELRAIAGGLL